MAYKSVLVGRVFALRWVRTPEIPDLKVLGRELPEYRKSIGPELVNLSLIPTDISPPEGAVRKEMEAFNRVFTECCTAVHVVVGGSGFKHAVLRSIVSAFALASRKRGFVVVHRSLDDAILELCGASGENEGKALRSRLTSEGLLDGM